MVEMHVREEDNNKLEKLVENSKLTRDREIKDPSTGGRALRILCMVINSIFERSTLDEVKKMDAIF